MNIGSMMRMTMVMVMMMLSGINLLLNIFYNVYSPSPYIERVKIGPD